LKLIILLAFLIFLIPIPSVYGQLSDRTGFKQEFQIETERYEFTVSMTSNFSVEKVDFSSEDKQLTIQLKSSLEKNLSEIQIPRNLVNGNFTFLLDGKEIHPNVKSNEKISFITLEFPGNGTHLLEIIGTTAIPEFSHLAPLVLGASFGILLLKRKNLQLFV